MNNENEILNLSIDLCITQEQAKELFEEKMSNEKKQIQLYINNSTEECKCCRCERVENILMDKDSYEFYCEQHLKEMLLENDAEVLTDFLSGGDDENNY